MWQRSLHANEVSYVVIGSTRGWTVISAVKKTGVTMAKSELVVALLISFQLVLNRATAQGEPHVRVCSPSGPAWAVQLRMLHVIQQIASD